MFIINVFVECHSKNQIFSYTEKKFDKEIVLAEGTQISLLHIFFIHFIFCGRRLQKIVVVICLSKICFSFACFKICFFNNLDWWSITKFSFILSHLVSVSASYFVIGFSLLFLLVLLHRKKKHSQESVKYFFQGKREAEGVEFLSEKSKNYLEREK